MPIISGLLSLLLFQFIIPVLEVTYNLAGYLALSIGETLVLLVHAIVFGLIKSEKKTEDVAELKSSLEKTESAISRQQEKSSLGAIWGIGGVFLILFVIAAVMKSDSTPASNSNSNMTNMANTTSCPKFSQGEFNLNLQPCKIYGRYGFSNSDGFLTINAVYEDADYFDQGTGLARVKKDGKWGFIDSNGNIKIKFLYDSAERFDLGSARVSIGQNTFRIDINGNKIQTSALNANSVTQTPIFNANSANQTQALNTNSATNQSNTISGNSPYPNVVRDAKGKLSPASGYRWVDSEDPNDFRVELMPGLIRTKDGKLSPDKGYRWVNRDDPKDFRVERIP